jgi:hypothetical protein
MRRKKKVRKRSQKITEHQEAIAAKIVAFTLAQQIPQDQFNHTNMDKEAYTHHEINAKLFLPSAIRCQLNLCRGCSFAVPGLGAHRRCFTVRLA